MSLTTDDVLYIGMKGYVLALNRESGEEIWRRSLKGSSFVNVAFDHGDLFAATRGEIFRLDPLTGEIRWTNPLKGMGFGLITFASGTAQPAIQAQLDEEAQQAASAS